MIISYQRSLSVYLGNDARKEDAEVSIFQQGRHVKNILPTIRGFVAWRQATVQRTAVYLKRKRASNDLSMRVLCGLYPCLRRSGDTEKGINILLDRFSDP